MNSTKRNAATIIALLVLSLLGMASATQAQAASSISGTVTVNGHRQPGVTATLFKYTSRGWVRTTVKTTTSSTGSYRITGLTDGYTYAIEAYRAYGRCGIGTGMDTYRGYSRNVYAGGAAYGANVAMSYETHINC